MADPFLPLGTASLKRWFAFEPGSGDPARRMVEVVKVTDVDHAFALLLRIYTHMAVAHDGWATIPHTSQLAHEIADLLGRERIVKGGA